MILAVDVGNTHVVLGCMEKGKIVAVARMATVTEKTEYEYAALMRDLLGAESIDFFGFEGTILSSVVPPLTNVMKQAIFRATGKMPLVVGAGVKTGLNIRLDNPAQLGSDLVVGAVAALKLYKPPMVIVDMGTATTLSAIGEDGSFLGGIICPGMALSYDALVNRTSQLPKISFEAPKNCIGTNTVDSMKSGAVYGAAAMIDGLVDRVEAQIGVKTTVIATGGLAGSVIPYCRHQIIINDDLLLCGLEVIYEKNKK